MLGFLDFGVLSFRVGWLLLGWVVGWLVGWLGGRLALLASLLAGWLAGWLAGFLGRSVGRSRVKIKHGHVRQASRDHAWCVELLCSAFRRLRTLLQLTLTWCLFWFVLRIPVSTIIAPHLGYSKQIFRFCFMFSLPEKMYIYKHGDCFGENLYQVTSLPFLTFTAKGHRADCRLILSNTKPPTRQSNAPPPGGSFSFALHLSTSMTKLRGLPC